MRAEFGRIESGQRGFGAFHLKPQAPLSSRTGALVDK
jgi:hypothetical protein